MNKTTATSSAVRASINRCIGAAARLTLPDTRAEYENTLLRLKDGALIKTSDRLWTLNSWGLQLPFELPEGCTASVLSKLMIDGLSLYELVKLYEGLPADIGFLDLQIQRLWRYRLLMKVLQSEGSALAVLHSADDVSIFPEGLHHSESLVLTESAYVRRHADHILVESVESGGRIELRDSRLFTVPTLLCTPRTVDELAHLKDFSQPTMTVLCDWLLNIGAVQKVASDPTSEQHLIGWSFADRLIHARSRSGTHIGGYGATFPLRGRVSEPSPIRPSYGTCIELPAPTDSSTFGQQSLLGVLDGRRSVRQHGEPAITLRELSEFLYHAVRIRRETDFNGAVTYKRPFPSAGGRYELEFYPLVDRCEGLTSGLYRYNGLDHALEYVTHPTFDTANMLQDITWATGTKEPPQILIIITARFRRLNWKYESIAYSLILKNVGVVYQTMYLVATALGLAPCAAGGGSGKAFCRAAGTHYLEESAVGEFILGRAASEM